MDDGFLIWPLHLNFNLFMNSLNNLHPAIKYAHEKANIQESSQSLNFLDVTVILKSDKSIETDVYYKATNSHDYLPYDSAHPNSCKKNIPFNLAKRIIVFVSNEKVMKIRLAELRSWLINRKYPDHVISQAFHNAKLQGPAPAPKQQESNIPFVTTFHSNTNNNFTINSIKSKINNSSSNYLKSFYDNYNIFLSQRQPRNLQSLLNQKTSKNKDINGIFKCSDERCKICSIYLQNVSNFKLANGQTWEVKSHITCHSCNVIYFLKCNICKKESYIGKTKGDYKHGRGFKVRMNQHISESKTGRSSCKFPIHVYNCGTKNYNLNEPFFEIYIMTSMNDDKRLESLETSFHKRGFDTLNK